MPIACAAIGVWYSLRQCFCQRYEAKLIGIKTGRLSVISHGLVSLNPSESATENLIA